VSPRIQVPDPHTPARACRGKPAAPRTVRNAESVVGARVEDVSPDRLPRFPDVNNPVTGP